jgi:hypothetical protein
MIIKFIKNLFSKKKEKKLEIEYSKYFPEKFFTGKLVKIDDSLKYFIKNSNVQFPIEPLIVAKIKQWSIEQDKFEEILFNGYDYKLIYDNTNSVFYLMELDSVDKNNRDMDADEILYEKDAFEKWSGTMHIVEKDELLSIFNRTISKEADEYLMLELNNKFTQSIYYGIIVQPNMIS